MTATALFTIWVSQSELAAPSTAAMSQAAREMLGAEVRLRTQSFPDGHPDVVPAPGARERTALLSWSSTLHEHALLRLCRKADDCVERWVAFDVSDPEVERGRTLGFLAATVFLDTDTPPEKPPEPPREPERTRPETGATFPRGEVTAAAAMSGPGDGTAVGASLGADYALSRNFRTGVAAEMRFGELDRAHASARVTSLALRATWIAARPARPVWLGVSAALGGYQLSVSHFSSDDTAPVRHSRLLLGGTASGVAGIDFGEASALYLELGAELLSGKTTVFVHEEPRATWPLLAPMARLGLRAGF